MGVLGLINRLREFLRLSTFDFFNVLEVLWDIVVNVNNSVINTLRLTYVRSFKVSSLRSITAELGLISLHTSVSNPNYEDLRYVALIYEANRED